MPSIYKKTDDTTYALGKTLVFELLKFSPKQCTCVYISDKTKKDESFAEIERLCKENNIGICLSNKIFNKLSDKENCYVIAEFKKWNGKIDVNGNHIVLVNPANTGNLGTIMRAALGFGIYDIALIGSSVDEFDPKTIRASMGSIFSLNIEHFNEYSDYSKKVSENRNIYPFMLKATTNLKNVVVDNNKK
jgi:TrmH family RNA methyltransferase